MKIYFLPIPAERTFTIFDSDTKRKFHFTVATNPHEVPDSLGEFLIKDRPILFGRLVRDIRIARGEVIPEKKVTEEIVEKITEKPVSKPSKKKKRKGGK